MLEKLKLVYGHHIISSPTNDKQTLWYQTDEGEIFGVNKTELTERKRFFSIHSSHQLMYLIRRKRKKNRNGTIISLKTNQSPSITPSVFIF
ncbi:hypothetical protein OE903_10440 [Bacillus sp. B6(2022)]|nr:hypothetical protein [Bacillus sp. B6(2022)]